MNISSKIKPTLTSSLDDQTLFLKQVPLTIKSHIKNPVSHEEKKIVITTVEVTLKNDGRTKTLQFTLTNDQDQFFLYNLSVAEEDFHFLKQEQNLLVDFQQFPLKFIELLEECIKAKEEENPKFLCQLVTDSLIKPTFSIIETNTFKQIIHLNLIFVPGNDENIKVYLAGLVKEFKKEIKSLNESLRSVEKQFSNSEENSSKTIKNLKLELENLKYEKQSELHERNLNFNKETLDLKEKFQSELLKERSEFEKLKKESELKFDEEIKLLQEHLIKCQTTVKYQEKQIQSLEETLKENTIKFEKTVKDWNYFQLENEIFSKENKNFEKLNSSLMEEKEKLKLDLSKLEKNLMEKDLENKKLLDKLNGINSGKTIIESTLDIYKKKTSDLEESMKTSIEEINKANDIIRRLQTDLKNQKQKLKLKTESYLQQEDLLKEKSDANLSIKNELETVKKDFLKTKEELVESLNTISQLNLKITESKNIIDDNNHVIEWLHKQLNEEALIRPVPSANLQGTGATGYKPINFDKYDNENELNNDRKSPTKNFRTRYTTTPNDNQNLASQSKYQSVLRINNIVNSKLPTSTPPKNNEQKNSLTKTSINKFNSNNTSPQRFQPRQSQQQQKNSVLNVDDRPITNTFTSKISTSNIATGYNGSNVGFANGGGNVGGERDRMRNLYPLKNFSDNHDRYLGENNGKSNYF
ncbi:Spindle assembly abnormal protein 6 [Lobulomyces angularis]|nr:Spindle assembly abnormal protein 6 [Lobulomyces angularis]